MPHSLLVAWKAPPSNGSPLTAYYIEVGAESGGGGGAGVVKVEACETQHNIVDLKPSTLYR